MWNIYPLNYLTHIGLMLTINVYIPVSSAYVGIQQGILYWQFSKQISMLFFQMSAQVYSVPGQTEGRRKAFLEQPRIDLSSKLSLTCGSNVNYYKSVHHPIPILPDKIWNTQAVFKTNQYALLSFECPGMFSFWPK